MGAFPSQEHPGGVFSVEGEASRWVEDWKVASFRRAAWCSRIAVDIAVQFP